MKAAAFVVLLTAVAQAAPPSQEELARSHYAAGEQEYARGRWNEALHEFQIGYALSPRPEFLINFAQVYRKLGDYDRAISECERYLATAPEASLAAQAQRLLDQLREERARMPKPAPQPPPTAATVTTPPPNPLATATSPPPRKPRRWVAPVVTVAAIVVAAGIVVGIVFATQPRDTFPSSPVGTVDFR